MMPDSAVSAHVGAEFARSHNDAASVMRSIDPEPVMLNAWR
jgi:hypothetical protein